MKNHPHDGFISIYYCQALCWVLEIVVNKTDKAPAPKLGKFEISTNTDGSEGLKILYTAAHLDNPIMRAWKFGLALSPDLINLRVSPTLFSSMSRSQLKQ